MPMIDTDTIPDGWRIVQDPRNRDQKEYKLTRFKATPDRDREVGSVVVQRRDDGYEVLTFKPDGEIPDIGEKLPMDSHSTYPTAKAAYIEAIRAVNDLEDEIKQLEIS